MGLDGGCTGFIAEAKKESDPTDWGLPGKSRALWSVRGVIGDADMWHRRMTWVSAWGIVLGGVLATGLAHAQDDAVPPKPAAAPKAAEGGEVGLQGMLPDEVPAGLGEDDFSVLGPNWQTWNEEMMTLLLGLYAPEQPLDVAAQRAQLAKIDSKRRTMAKLIDDPAYVVIRDALVSLNGKLLRRLEVDNAILKTLEIDPAGAFANRTAEAGKGILAALAALESDVNAFSGGAAWLDYVKGAELRTALGPDGKAEAAFELVNNVTDKLKKRNTLSPEAQQFASRPAFLALEAALDRYLAEVLRANVPYAPNLRSKLAALVGAIERYEAQNLAGDAGELKTALNDVRFFAADGGTLIEPVVRTHYLNYNMQALISESLMAKWVSDSKCEFAPVRDYALGAHIRGWSTTRSYASFDLKPSGDGSRFEIKIDGQSHTNTMGYTDRATIQSVGNHTFHATKSGYFDGEYFRTQSAAVSVNPSTAPVAATTKYDWIPLIGRIARGVAMDEAWNRNGQARAVAADRMLRRVGPEIDTQVDTSFADATRDLQTDLFVRLKNAGLYSQTNKILSTEDMMRVSSRVGLDNEPAGAAPEAAFPPGNGVTINVHESLLNNGANRWGFAGRTMTELQVRQELSAYFTALAKKKVDFVKDYNAKAEGPNVYVFDAKDPVRFQIDDGQVNLIIRAAFKEEGKEDIPPQIVTIPLIPRLEGADIVVERGQVKVAPVNKPDQVALQLARAGIIRKKIETQFPPKRETRKVELTRTNKSPITLWVMKIKPINGWLSVWAE